jgi:hypothetical protein
LLLSPLVLLILPAQLNPRNFIQDDSYFYLQVASNIVAGQGSTFSTITPTNGYHPLWMFFCVVAFLVAAGNKLVALHVVVALQALLAVGTLQYFRKLIGLMTLPFWSAGAGLLGAFLLATAMYGSEAYLNAFLLMAGMYYLSAATFRGSRSGWTTAGLILGLAVLARLDNVFVVGCVIIGLSLAGDSFDLRSLIRRVFRVGLPIVAVLTPYLVYNQVRFGHLMPISGAIKSSFPSITWDIGSLGTLGLVSALAGLGSLALAVLVRDRLARLLLVGLGAGVFMHALYVVLFTEHYTFWSWYYVAGVINMALLGVLAFDVLRRRLAWPWVGAAVPRLASFATAAFVILGVAYAWSKAYPNLGIGSFRPGRTLNEYRWPDELARWMQHYLPPNSGVLVYDFPGTLAYYSGLRILPTDGLINDFSYDEEIVSLGISRYLCEKDVDYYFGHIFRGEAAIGPGRELEIRPLPLGGQEIKVKAPLSRRSAGSIEVWGANLVVRVREIVRLPGRTPDLAIWRLDPCRQAVAPRGG